MTEKIFTEEDYQKIVDIADNTIKGIFFGKKPIENFWGKLLDSRVGEKFFLSTYGKEIMAIANLLTREWAHDQFVEKEKKYYWKSKKTDEDGDYLILFKDSSGAILNDYERDRDYKRLTESEIREWGYNPDMFDREEVE